MLHSRSYIVVPDPVKDRDGSHSSQTERYGALLASSGAAITVSPLHEFRSHVLAARMTQISGRSTLRRCTLRQNWAVSFSVSPGMGKTFTGFPPTRSQISIPPSVKGNLIQKRVDRAVESSVCRRPNQRVASSDVGAAGRCSADSGCDHSAESLLWLPPLLSPSRSLPRRCSKEQGRMLRSASNLLPAFFWIPSG